VVETPAPVEHAADPAGVAVAISNRNRIIYLESHITKGQLADYYEAIAPVMLPWI